MAAHSVTILTEFAGKYNLTGIDKTMLRQALNYAPGMDELGEQWRDLSEVLDSGDDDQLRTKLRQTLARQCVEWLILGEPSCHEDWAARRYSDDFVPVLIEDEQTLLELLYCLDPENASSEEYRHGALAASHPWNSLDFCESSDIPSHFDTRF